MSLLIQLYEENPAALVALILAVIVGGIVGMVLVIKLTRIILKILAILAAGAIIMVVILTLLSRGKSAAPVEPEARPEVTTPDDPAVTSHPTE